MPTTVKTMTAWQRSQIGTKENPLGSNNVIYNTHYYNQQVSGDGYAWCCAYQWDGFRECGASELFFDGRKTAYVPTLHEWARTKSLLTNEPKEGDLIIFDWNNNKVGDHVGYCTSATSDTITTIDGNVDNMVTEITRDRKYVLAIIRPKYTPEPDSVCSAETCPIIQFLTRLMKGD